MKFYIGMHFAFDHEKYAKDYYGRISGIEVCNFTSKDEILAVVELARRDGFQLGIHFPFYKLNYKYRDPLMLSLDENERDNAFSAIEKEMIYAKEINAEYLLMHFPKPMVLSKKDNWCMARLGDHEFVYDDEISFESFERLTEQAFIKLDALHKKTGVKVVLEIELINHWIYETDLLDRLLERYNHIKVCLDTARLHVVDKIDSNFSVCDFVARMAKYTSNLHVANIQVNEEIKNGHHPALPTLKSEEGWCEIGPILSSLKNTSCIEHVLFEHRSDNLTKNDLTLCYDWIYQQL